MIITDLDAAHSCLERIGYYRLSAYWFPFRRANNSAEFKPGTTFQQVMDLYILDKRLRLLFMDALERVEVALRVNVALLLAAREPWAHRDPNQLHGKFAKINPHTGRSRHQDWLAKLDRKFADSNEEFVKHFKQKYSSERLPLWMAIELWDFGMLSVLVSGMQYKDQEQLAAKYHLPRPTLLTSWVRNLNYVRNLCAHYCRLWNRSPLDQIAPPRIGEITLLDHLVLNKKALVRVYASAAILQFLLRTIHPTSSWSHRLERLYATFPTTESVKLTQAGFPLNWEGLDLWGSS